MKRQPLGVGILMLVLTLGSPLTSRSAQNPACPWVPRDGIWRLEAGNMSVEGLWTPLGGGELDVTVTVIGCGERIEADIPDGVGKVVFEPYEGGLDFPGRNMPQLIRDLLDAQAQETFGSTGGPNADAIPLWDTPKARAVDLAQRVSEANRAELLTPPADLNLWETNVYRADFRTGVGWYLDYVHQYSMFSTTTSEDVDPVHLQFHRWTFLRER